MTSGSQHPEPELIAEYACAADPNERPLKRRRSLHHWLNQHPRFIPLYSHSYQALMRFSHRYGWHYTKPCGPANEQLWCHWCGLRGRNPATLIDGEAS